jgi:multidrug efflux pump subunit AcrB
MRLIPLTLLLALPPGVAAAPPVLIEANYPGASAEVVAATVTAPLEVALHGTEDVERIRSLSSNDGRCFIRLDLKAGADYQKVRAAIADRLAFSKASVPRLVADSVRVLAATDDSFLIVAVRPGSQTSLRALSAAVKDTVRPRLQRIPGVTQVNAVGEEREQLRFVLDPARLAARALAPGDVFSALQQVARATPRKAEELTEIVIAEKGRQKILLGDLGRLMRIPDPLGAAGVAARGDEPGKKGVVSRAVLLVLRPGPGRGEAVTKAVAAALAEMAPRLPEGTRFETRLFGPDDLAVVLPAPSDADLTRRADMGRAAAEAVLRVPRVQTAFWLTQAEGGETTVLLSAPGAQEADVRAALQAVLDQKGQAVIVVKGLRSPLRHWPGEGRQLVARVCGRNREEVGKTAERLRERLSRVKGVVDLYRCPPVGAQLTIQFDRAKLPALGLSPRDVSVSMQVILGGATVMGLVRPARKFRLTLPDSSQKKSVEELGTVLLVARKEKPVPLREVATIKRSLGPTTIFREDLRDCVVVSGNVQGREVEAVRDELHKLAQELSSKGVRVEVP